MLILAGIDMQKHRVHDTRKASANAALRSGLDPEDVLWKGGWKSKTVFEEFYNRSRQITNVMEGLAKDVVQNLPSPNPDSDVVHVTEQAIEGHNTVSTACTGSLTTSVRDGGSTTGHEEVANISPEKQANNLVIRIRRSYLRDTSPIVAEAESTEGRYSPLHYSSPSIDNSYEYNE